MGWRCRMALVIRYTKLSLTGGYPGLRADRGSPFQENDPSWMEGKHIESPEIDRD
jgi:hypothetical protein